LKGKVIAVNRGSIYDTWARDNLAKYGFQVESYNTTPDAVQAVLAGRTFANLAGNTATAWAVKRTPGLKLSYLIRTGLVWAVTFSAASISRCARKSWCSSSGRRDRARARCCAA